MIQLLLPLLILPAQTTAPMEQRYAEPMYRTGFEQADDINYDGWPDKWTRQRGLGYPHYVDVAIVANPDARGPQDAGHCLRIDLDGGAAAVFSPPIEVSSQFSYALQGKLKTWGLTHDVAYLSVTLLDQDQQQQEVCLSEKLTRAEHWRELTIGPLTPSRSDVRYAVIGLHVTPTAKEDLVGTALFDDICFARFPNMSLEANQPHNLFAAGAVPEITCTVSGIRRDGAVVIFELVDVSGRTVLAEQKMLANAVDPLTQLTWAAALSNAPTKSSSAATDQGGTVAWHPRLPDLGYYTIRALLRSDDRVTLQRTISIAVVRNLGTRRKGEFGWSLTRHTHNMSGPQLLNLLSLANASWVKYPVWYGPADDQVEGERIADLADRLSATGIEMVGVFDAPPANVFKRLGQKGHLSVAEAFLEPNYWQPAIEPLMVRLSLKIRWWQLGTDHDESFIDYQGLEEKIGEIRTHFKKYGQRTRLGLPWRWLHELPSSQQDAPWDFLAMSESPSFTSGELARYAETTQQAPGKTWVTLTPLPRHSYDNSTRAQDLVRRMVQAKIDGVSAIFADDPFDDTCGLLNEGGTPNELFLPWCITAKLIGGAEYLGSLQLPNDSENHVFAVDDQAVMVVWNQTPVTESLYLGDDVVRVDPWGRETALSPAKAARRRTPGFGGRSAARLCPRPEPGCGPLAAGVPIRTEPAGKHVPSPAELELPSPKPAAARCGRHAGPAYAGGLGRQQFAAAVQVGGRRIAQPELPGCAVRQCQQRPAKCPHRLRIAGR